MNQRYCKDIAVKLKEADIITLNKAHHSHVKANCHSNAEICVRKEM